MIKAVSGARIVLLAPPSCETLPPPLPDMTSQNRRLAKYRESIRELARSQDCDLSSLTWMAPGAGQRLLPATELRFL